MADSDSDLRKQWVRETHVTRADSSAGPVHWLLGRRSASYAEPPHWFAHGTRWMRGGRPHCVLGQPAYLDCEDIAELAELESEHGLGVTISTYPSWHNPGHVLSVLVTI